MSIYDVIIVGAGASGLFCSASFPTKVKGLILEKNSKPGAKLLLTGAGQCNLTHSGDIKGFLPKYGQNGRLIRTTLYQFNNLALKEFFESRGLPLLTREDGKVFPSSLRSEDVLKLLLHHSEKKGFRLLCDAEVTEIQYSPRTLLYTVITGNTRSQTKNLVIAAGGRSYPQTGSDGSILNVLKSFEETRNAELQVVPMRPSLAPVYVQEYPYALLSGLSLSTTGITIHMRGSTETNKGVPYLKKREIKTTGSLLFTHRGFSGPVILDHSRYVQPGDTMIFNYLPGVPPLEVEKRLKLRLVKNQKHFESVLYEYLNFEASYYNASFSRRFVRILCERCGVNSVLKSASIPADQLREIVHLLTEDRFSVSGVAGYDQAMSTVGGISLEEIDPKTMECKKLPGLYFIGEILDVDGDTGGYNLQFAFSSAYAAGKNIDKKCAGSF